MATSNSLSSRLEELRSRNPQSPPGESPYSGYNTPTRYSGSYLLNHSSHSASSENKANMQRRFTADSNNAPTVSAMGPPPLPNQNVDPVDMSASTKFKADMITQKRVELQKMREHRMRLDLELKKFDRQQAQEEKELERISNEIRRLSLSAGHQSEPTTPPEYRDQSLPSSAYSRRNRYSSASLISPQGQGNRIGNAGSQLTSPAPESVQNQNMRDSDKLPSKSVPGSRRGSSDRFASYVHENGAIGQRSTANNRYSMPVTSSMKQKRESVPEYNSMGLSHINTTHFLLNDDDEKHSARKESATSPDVTSYLQMNTTDDKFPILVRNNHQPGVLSASSAALDLALSQSPGPESKSRGDGWSSFARHRHSQASLPQNVFGEKSTPQSLTSPSHSQQSFEPVLDSPTPMRQPNRHSMEASLTSLTQKSVLSSNVTNGTSMARPNNLQSSYSTNDIPTLKTGSATTTIAPQATHAEKHFQNHNASLGRIPPNAVNKRVSRDLASGESRRDEPTNGMKHSQSELQASAPPFGPSTTVGSPVEPIDSIVNAPGMQQFAGPTYYGGYGMQMMNMGIASAQMGTPQFQNVGQNVGQNMGQNMNQNVAPNMSLYQAQSTQYGPYGPYQNGRFPDSQARVIQQRRMQNAEDNARFNNAKIENYIGEIYSLCKDQHGCRFLQKQLESRNPERIHIIFVETQPHVVELMTDPFGNYLCQKLLEHSNDGQRNLLVNSAAPQMVKVALNQHGTRALQKMIEFITTPEQTQTIVHALKDHVVELIKDLNGNHVIQKCLNRLAAEDAQFIFDAVGKNCVIVGTHRHGCCVLQRCIDHASGQQKADLIAQITQNAFSLVQDPYGNYVLQYIVDLDDPVFTNPLCYSFQTRVVDLSKHKFSSNVVEKCLRHAESHIAAMMIDEMLNANELERMLRDQFANYVVQTAVDAATGETRARVMEEIKPILPSIRQTPYGRRLQAKINGQGNSGHVSPVEGDIGHHGMARSMSGGHGRFGGSHRPTGIYGNHNQTVFGMNGAAGMNGMNPMNGMNGMNGMNMSAMNGMNMSAMNGMNMSAMNMNPMNGMNGVNGMNGMHGMMGQAPYLPSTSANGHNPRLGNGSANYGPFHPPKGQNVANQPVQGYGRNPQANGGNFF